MMNLQENKTAIFDNVSKLALKAGRAHESVHIVAVTKYVNCQTTEALIRTGVNHIGENRVDKFLEKYQALKDEKLHGISLVVYNVEKLKMSLIMLIIFML